MALQYIALHYITYWLLLICFLDVAGLPLLWSLLFSFFINIFHHYSALHQFLLYLVLPRLFFYTSLVTQVSFWLIVRWFDIVDSITFSMHSVNIVQFSSVFYLIYHAIFCMSISRINFLAWSWFRRGRLGLGNNCSYIDPRCLQSFLPILSQMSPSVPDC